MGLVAIQRMKKIKKIFKTDFIYFFKKKREKGTEGEKAYLIVQQIFSPQDFLCQGDENKEK